jgi:hypothetical protein
MADVPVLDEFSHRFVHAVSGRIARATALAE